LAGRIDHATARARTNQRLSGGASTMNSPSPTLDRPCWRRSPGTGSHPTAVRRPRAAPIETATWASGR
jgi:hypothetical protein